MGMIKKEVTGSAEALKSVQNGKNAPKTPTGGTGRTSFTGSNDSRTAGKVNTNATLKRADGYINDGPVSSDLSENHGGSYVSGGPKSGGAMTGQVTPAKEDVTKGMGGRVIKNME